MKISHYHSLLLIIIHLCPYPGGPRRWRRRGRRGGGRRRRRAGRAARRTSALAHALFLFCVEISAVSVSVDTPGVNPTGYICSLVGQEIRFL